MGAVHRLASPGYKDRKAHQYITLLKDIVRNHPFDGLGKPEPLKGNLSGFWSRRIDGYNRLVYRIEGDVCQVIQCKGHYGQ
ncbi:Txe/YoeB family addiction module toxin [Desulfovibrionales bacterium]